MLNQKKFYSNILCSPYITLDDKGTVHITYEKIGIYTTILNDCEKSKII